MGFPGGYDSGVPGEDTPDLMGYVCVCTND